MKKRQRLNVSIASYWCFSALDPQDKDMKELALLLHLSFPIPPNWANKKVGVSSDMGIMALLMMGNPFKFVVLLVIVILSLHHLFSSIMAGMGRMVLLVLLILYSPQTNLPLNENEGDMSLLLSMHPKAFRFPRSRNLRDEN